MRIYIVILLSMFFLPLINAQESANPYLIKGKVIDEQTNTPLEFSAVTAYSATDKTLISGDITDEDGYFEIEATAGVFYLVIEFISYHPSTIENVILTSQNRVVDLGEILLSTNAASLQAVEIVAEKSTTTFNLDKRVFNVGQDLANRGGTATDILDNVPSVTVDIDGNVSLRGSDNVRILIDGRPSGLIGTRGSDGLKAIAANMIDRVEVITNPSARYEAEGMSGIINIVLKKDTKAGLNGSFEVSGGYPETYGTGVNLNYRKGRTNFFVNYGLNFGNSPATGYTYQEIFNGDAADATYSTRDTKRKNISNSIRGGIDFSLSDSEVLTGYFLYRKRKSDNIALVNYYDHHFAAGDPRGSQLIPRADYTGRVEDETQSYPFHEYKLDYTKKYKRQGRELLASAQYSQYGGTELSDYNEAFYLGGIAQGDKILQRSENDEGNKNFIASVDYTHPFGKDSKFETGLRSELKRIDNKYIVEEFGDNDWFTVPGFSNQFIYDEDIHAGYAIYGSKINNFSYQAGLRAEYTDLKTELVETHQQNPRNYFSFFPSGHINYELPGDNQLQVSYSRRIRRPHFWHLNPFYSYADNRNTTSGNPLLNPEFTDSYEIGHLKYWTNGNIGTNVYYRHTTDVIQRITQFFPDGTTLSQPINLGTGNYTGLEFLVAYNPYKWLRLDGNINAFKSVVNGTYEGQDYGIDGFSWYGRVGGKASFWKNAEFQARLNYRGPQDIPQGTRKALYIVDIAFSKDFLNNNATLTIATRDLFNSRRRNTELLTEEFYQRVNSQWRRAPIMATLSYRLNTSKPKKKPGMNSQGGDGDFDGGGEM